MAEPLRLRVGASKDASFDQVMRSVVDSARAAQKAIAAEETSAGATRVATARRSGGEVTAEARKAARDRVKIERDTAKDYRKAAKDLDGELAKIGKDRTKRDSAEARKRNADSKEAARQKVQDEREADKQIVDAKRKRAKDEKDLLQSVARAANQYATEQRDTERANAASNRRAMSTAGRVAGGAGRLASGALGQARRIVGEVAQGFGIDADAGSQLRSSVSLQSRATNLSNSGYMAGNDRNGERVSSRELVQQARSVSDATGLGADTVIGGLEKFTGLTGDLKTGREMIKDLAIYAKASGADLDDMAAAAGNVANGLGDIEGKSARVSELMRLFVGQGKQGAVEIKDMASQMAKVTAAASTFSGDKAQNIALMGAFGQAARAKGGAASATSAATSVVSFANQFGKGARAEGFKGLGIDIYTDSSKREIKDPRALLVDLISKSRGSVAKMEPAISDAAAKRITKAYSSVYRDTYNATSGDDKAKDAEGVRAVQEFIDAQLKAAVKQREIEDSFAAAMATGETAANQLNNALGGAADDIIVSLTPAIKGMIGPATQYASALAGAIAKLTGQSDKDTQDKLYDVGGKAQNLNTALRGEANAAGVEGPGGEKGKVDPVRLAKTEGIIKADQEAIDKAQAELDADKKKESMVAKLRTGAGVINDFFGKPVAEQGFKDSQNINQQQQTTLELRQKDIDLNRANVEKLKAQVDYSKMLVDQNVVQTTVLSEMRDLINERLNPKGKPAPPHTPGGATGPDEP